MVEVFVTDPFGLVTIDVVVFEVGSLDELAAEDPETGVLATCGILGIFGTSGMSGTSGNSVEFQLLPEVEIDAASRVAGIAKAKERIVSMIVYVSSSLFMSDLLYK